MKVINNTDINNLIIYSKKNLGIYKLVYKEYKKVYWTSITLIILSIVFLIMYILLLSFKVNIFENICFAFCFITSIFSLYLLQALDKKTNDKHMKVQDYRIELLKIYYQNNNYSFGDIKKINEQLKARIEKIEKQKITILIVAGVLILPIWDVFVQYYFIEFSPQQFIKIILFSVLISFIAVIIIKICNRGLYLYEENIYLKNNIHLIENLIYLNTYIIQEEEE